MLDALNWPTATLVFGLVFVLAFYKPIANLLLRTKKLGKGGLEAFDNAQLPAHPESPTEVEKFLRTYDNPLLLLQEQRIRDDLKERKVGAPADLEKMLVRALAGTQLLLHFERVYSSIYSSQVAILNFLNARQDGALPNELMPFYDDAKTRFPEIYVSHPPDAYFDYLSSFNLIENRSGRVAITTAGREFLKWLIETGKPGPFHG